MPRFVLVVALLACSACASTSASKKEALPEMTTEAAPAAEPAVQLTRGDEIEWVELKAGVQMATSAELT